MLLLKNGEILDDPWLTVGPDDQPPSDRPAIIGLEHWQARRDELIGRNQPLGLRLAGRNTATAMRQLDTLPNELSDGCQQSESVW